MVSSRTAYREKRIDLITDCIRELSKLLLLYKRDLETIKLPLLKKLHEQVFSLRKSENDEKDFPTGSKKEQITYPTRKHHSKGIKSSNFSEDKK